MITSLGAEAVERAQAIARQADIIAALTLEVLKGTTKAFDSGESRSSRHGWRAGFISNLSASALPSVLVLKTSTCCVPTRARWRWPYASARCWTRTITRPRLQVRGGTRKQLKSR